LEQHEIIKKKIKRWAPVHFFGGKFSHCGEKKKKKTPWVNYKKAVYEKKEKKGKKITSHHI
jgi:hypothetical protein